ncbi:histidine phosphatase family protein [Empedobacter falsenii]
MKEIWFIRHGESMANAGYKTTDHATIPLTEKGKEQAIIVSKEITKKPDLIVLTKFSRTHETAEPTFNKFNGTKIQILDLHEYNYLAENRCIDLTPKERKPLVDEYFDRCNANFIDGEGAESFVQFHHRIITSLKKLEQKNEEFIVVFTHGNVMRLIWQYINHKTLTVNDTVMKDFHGLTTSLAVPNTKIFKTTFDDNTWILNDE